MLVVFTVVSLTASALPRHGSAHPRRLTGDSDDATALQRRLQGPPPTSGYTLHYIIDPTGWGIQLDMNFEAQPSGCSNSLLGAEDGSSYNPACDLGTC